MCLSIGGYGGCSIGNTYLDPGPADDYQFSGSVPEPINKEAWFGMSASWKTASPRLGLSFDLTNMNMGVIPATHKTFSAKREKIRVTVREDKITSWTVEPTEGAGLMAILCQLGVELISV